MQYMHESYLTTLDTILGSSVFPFFLVGDTKLDASNWMRFTTQNSNYFAEEVVAKDRSRAVLTVMRALVIANDEMRRFYPVGLEEDALYNIPELELTLHGSTIMNAGIKLAFAKGDFATATVHIEKV